MSPAKIPQLRCDLVPENASSQQEEGLSADFLRHFCEAENLDDVTRLDIQVDSVQQNLENLGEHLGNLSQLKLTDSSVMCLRDLGTSLRSLEILWMSRCGLQDLGGAAAAFPALRELYIPFNDISDLSPLSGHEGLEVVDLEGNAVNELDEVSALGLCPQLRELTLRGNPLYRSSSPRQAVLELLPQLAILDDAGRDQLVVPEDASLELDPLFGIEDERRDAGGHRPDADVDPINPLQPSHPLLAQGLQESRTAAARAGRPYAGEPDEDELVVEGLKRARPRPVAFHAFTARPAPNRPATGLQAPDRRQARTADSELVSFRPATAANSRLHFDDLRSSQDTASNLTCGAPLAGGPLSAVRQHRVQAAVTPEAGEPELGIRELLRRYRTYTQPSCIPTDELLLRMREADGKRPSTPDVRIHVPGLMQSIGSARATASGGAGGDGRLRTSGGRAGGSADAAPLPPLSPPAGGGPVVPPSMVTSLGETLILDTETPVDLE